MIYHCGFMCSFYFQATIFYPNMWLGGGLNPEQWYPEEWFKFKVKTGQVIDPQGTVLVRVTQPLMLDSSGHLFQAEYLTASDLHYRWWMTQGEGQGLRKNATYHSCGVRVHECPFKKGKTRIIHLERTRPIGAKEWKANTPSWCFRLPCKKEIQDFHDAMAKSKEDEPGVVSLPLADSDPGEDSSLEESKEDDKGTAEKIARSKAELERLEKGAKADQKAKKKKKKKHVTHKGGDREVKEKKKTKKEKKEAQRRKAESDEDEAERKKKRKKKRAQEESETSEDDSSAEDLFVAKMPFTRRRATEVPSAQAFLWISMRMSPPNLTTGQFFARPPPSQRNQGS